MHVCMQVYATMFFSYTDIETHKRMVIHIYVTRLYSYIHTHMQAYMRTYIKLVHDSMSRYDYVHIILKPIA